MCRHIFPKVFWQLWSPNANWACYLPPRRRIDIHDIPIGIMLNLEPTWIFPVIKDLTAQNMSPYTPHTLPSLLSQPLMSKQLGVKVGNFKAGMVEIGFLDFGWSTLHEEDVVIGIPLAEIEMHESEDVDILKFGVPENICGNDIEVLRIKCEFVIEVTTYIAEVTEFMNERRTGMKALKLSYSCYFNVQI